MGHLSDQVLMIFSDEKIRRGNLAYNRENNNAKHYLKY